MDVKSILQLLASLSATVGIAPAFLYLDPLAQISGLLALISGFLLDRRKSKLLAPLPATLASLACFFFYLIQMSASNIVTPLLNMLVVLLAVRLVTEKSGRNLLQIFVLATFVLAASSLLSLSAFYLACLTLLIVLVTFGLLLTSFFVTDPQLRLHRAEWRTLLKTGALLPAGSLILMLFFFALLPRTEHPLWNFLNPKVKPAAGFSEEVKPGSLTNLGQSGTPAFRAEMDPVNPKELYWRGLVLNQTDGRSWTRGKTPPPDAISHRNPQINTAAILSEPRTDRYLPGLDLTTGISGLPSQFFLDAVYESRRRLSKRSQYQINYTLRDRLKLKNLLDTGYYLQTPAHVSPRVTAVAEAISREATRAAKIVATSRFFREQQLSYAARNLQLSDDPVDHFLFNSRRGYCEYFASSFALILRLAGVPSRLVGGYLGGRYNELGGYYLVDEDMAHVWVEVLDDENVWQRIDPSRLAINAVEAVVGLSRNKFNRTQALIDYFDIAWSRLVISYDLRSQFRLAFAVGHNLRQLKPQRASGYLWWLVGGALLFLPRLVKHRKKPRSRRERTLDSYLKQVRRLCGDEVLSPALGLYRLATATTEPLFFEFAQLYGAHIYTDTPLSKETYGRLRQIIRQLARRKTKIPFNQRTLQ